VRLAFDVEGNGYEKECTKLHCIVAIDLDTGATHQFSDGFRKGDLEDGVRFIENATELWGHNITDYDVPVLRRLYGFEPPALLFDTLRGSRQAYPGKELNKKDMVLIRRGTMPIKATEKPHALATWGYRLGFQKGECTDFTVWTPAMQEYCVNDVQLTVKVIEHLLKVTTRDVILNETRCAELLWEQYKVGVGFNVEAAAALAARLAGRREGLTVQLRGMYPAWYVRDGKVKCPKRGNKKLGTAEGCEHQGIKLVEFNPASGAHVTRVLKKYRGWEPQNFTDSGLPETSEEVIGDLPWPECRLFVEYQRIKKLIGYISEGEMAWLKLEVNGSLHGRVHVTGAVTNRSSHVQPNLGQTPSVKKPYGKECRSLFVARPGYTMVGADASGLQLRLLGHYLAPYDGGKFARVCETGDVHTYMQEGTGLIQRDNSKTAHYAWVFGAGFFKLGSIAIFDFANSLEMGLWEGEVPPLKRAPQIGQRVKAGLEAKLQMRGLNANLKTAWRRGFLRSFDGRSIPVLSKHTALCSLLQGGEAVIMKHAMLRARELNADLPARQVLWVHDEWQWEARPEVAEQAGRNLVQAIVETGEKFGLRCRLDAKYAIGHNWSETH
jgi:hypothetical protein